MSRAIVFQLVVWAFYRFFYDDVPDFAQQNFGGRIAKAIQMKWNFNVFIQFFQHKC